MKIPELRSYRLNTQYRLTPLFWKTIGGVVLFALIAIVALIDFPASSISIANASDMDELSQYLAGQQSAPEGSENLPIHSTTSSAILPTDSAILSAGTSNTSAPNSQTNNFNGVSSDSPVPPAKPIDTAPVDGGLFSRSAFVGDSRSEGLLLYSGVKGATDYANKGLNLKSVFSNAFVSSSSGKKVTILTDMKSKSFDKIFISFGLNELGWSSDNYLKKYKDLVSQIRAAQPDASIYIQSTFPINPDKCKFTGDTNKQVLNMNAQLKKMADELDNVYFVDIHDRFMDSRGYLTPEASSDGIHLNSKYCKYWLKCLEESLTGLAASAPVVTVSEPAVATVPSPPAITSDAGLNSLDDSEMVGNDFD